MTPPLTPTGSRHAKSSSTSSDFLASISGLRRGDSLSSSAGRLSIDDSARPGSTELLAFPHHLIDYQIQTDGDGSKRPIGCGAWGDVYLAQPSLPQQSDQPLVIPCGSSMSPPITPVRSRGSSIGTSILPSMPSRYAIKVPGSASAKKVLTAEARILSYLSQFPDADNHVVPFYGQDTRTGALVLKALDGTLDVWIETHLNTLDEPNRAQKLASIFPTIALSLIDSLTWMQSKDCTHADIKPANILTSASTSSSITPTLIFSDFSSSILTALATDDATPPPMGAGTWDFLDPSLLSFFNTPAPSAATDLWSLGITLLFLVLGTSPFDAFKQNKFQQREMIKSGTPLQCMAYDDQGIVNMRRMKGLSRDLGFDVSRWFAKVLVKSAEKRVSVGVWREELVGSLESGKRM
ncbi:kinase-like protein [Ophiobolus disseminans]|uniref:Autophagy-related protein 1 n=1 Tax=Ophiobolus disseminans TaxID=1469910 RepID=A0A6A7AI65_9PLEO|nr:kinase-like protein [Ophiobolus disseminans]